jgi:hypothetical protein
VLEVALDGLAGEEESRCDVLVGVTVGDELGDAKLAWCQGPIGLSSPSASALRQSRYSISSRVGES